MRKIYNLTKDASIYQNFYWRNTGADEILEVGKYEGTSDVRTLVQFDVATLSASMASGIIPANASFDLKLFVARADDIVTGQTIEIHQVSSSWVEGTGYFYQNTNVPFTSSRNPSVGYYENDGATWRNRLSGSTWASTGSDFYSATSASASLTDPITDVIFDITNCVRSFISASIPNNGLLLKFPYADELNNANNGNIRFFSRQTHTVYAPQFIAKWNDQIYLTGSTTASNQWGIVVTPRNLKPSYVQNEVVKINLSVRDEYPLKTFDNAFNAYAGDQRLPTSSYFSVVDVQSNAVIIPFDAYSPISCDGTGSYFIFSVQGMYPGRYYKILTKVVNQDSEQVFETGHQFTIRVT